MARSEPWPVMVNPATGEEFVLLRKERFEAMQKWITPLNATGTIPPTTT